MGAVTLGGSEELVPRDATGHDRTSGSVATSGEMTQIHNRSGSARLPGPRLARLLSQYHAGGVWRIRTSLRHTPAPLVTAKGHENEQI